MEHDAQLHWESVWRDGEPTEVSWFQADPATSRRLIARVARPQSAIIDVGGGGSRLVDHLLDDGFRDLTVLDISEAALDVSRRRLGDRAAAVEWIVDDVTEYRSDRRLDVWHDRAVFHFLVDVEDRERYRSTLAANVVPGGHVVVAT
ncbi:MAG: class I SAM-dependent methyltransferase, partial [Ilumatobacter sp.]|nr:class I SAM-dependent methyltransferase [Ilumatobacter sp.]